MIDVIVKLCLSSSLFTFVTEERTKTKNDSDMKRIFTICAVLLVSVTALAQEAPKYYGIKSGEMKTETDLMGQKIEATTYFDDYGRLQYARTKMSTMGIDIDMGTISRDGKSYMVNYGEKTVQEMPAQESINYLDLNEAAVAKYKVKEIGKEIVDGKECTVYTLEISQMGQTAKTKAWVWNGVPMKTVTDAMGMSITATVSEIKEGPVDASLFEVPKF